MHHIEDHEVSFKSTCDIVILMTEFHDLDRGGETGHRLSDDRGLLSSTAAMLPTVFPQLYAVCLQNGETRMELSSSWFHAGSEMAEKLSIV